MRLFVAIGLEGKAAAAVEQVRQRLAAAGQGLRWSQPADRHLTLQFLGEASPEQAECVMERLRAVRSAAVPVRIAGIGFFMRAGVFWAGVEATAELLALQQRVTAATRACGFVAEPRVYRPHVTLARSRGRSGAGALVALEAAVEGKRIRLAAECLAQDYALYESFTGPSRYEVRARFPLGVE